MTDSSSHGETIRNNDCGRLDRVNAAACNVFLDPARPRLLRWLVSTEPEITDGRRANANQTNPVHLGPCTQYHCLGRLLLSHPGDGNRLRIDSSSQDGGLNLDSTQGGGMGNASEQPEGWHSPLKTGQQRPSAFLLADEDSLPFSQCGRDRVITSS